MNQLTKKSYASELIVFSISAVFLYLFLVLQSASSEYMKNFGTFDIVYFPAGIAFVAILVGGISGALGVIFVLIMNYTINYPDVFWLTIVAIVSFSITVQMVVVKSYLSLVGVGPNLEKFSHIQLLGLALLFSVSHSLCHYFNLVAISNFQIGWAKSMIALSTFLGVFFTLMVLWFFSKSINYFFGSSDSLPL